VKNLDIQYLGHSVFRLSDGNVDVLIDPWFNGNPKAAASADEVPADVIALTHGHGDHFGDCEAIAKRTGATVVAITEIAGEIGENNEGLDIRDPNMGGTVKFDWGWIKLVPALHTSTTPRGTSSLAGGLLVNIDGKLVYHLGDTALFSDLRLIARRGDHVDVALMPIGGHYTMDRIDAVTAVEFVDPTTVIPCHYNTFPPIATDAEAFKSDVEGSTGASVAVLEPGETHSE
jgi:L-ascorbate metabolism protein UlaG (beta-lactamase superfamily)